MRVERPYTGGNLLIPARRGFPIQDAGSPVESPDRVKIRNKLVPAGKRTKDLHLGAHSARFENCKNSCERLHGNLGLVLALVETVETEKDSVGFG